MLETSDFLDNCWSVTLERRYIVVLMSYYTVWFYMNSVFLRAIDVPFDSYLSILLNS